MLTLLSLRLVACYQEFDDATSEYNALEKKLKPNKSNKKKSIESNTSNTNQLRLTWLKDNIIKKTTLGVYSLTAGIRRVITAMYTPYVAE